MPIIFNTFAYKSTCSGLFCDRLFCCEHSWTRGLCLLGQRLEGPTQLSHLATLPKKQKPRVQTARFSSLLPLPNIRCSMCHTLSVPGQPSSAPHAPRIHPAPLPHDSPTTLWFRVSEARFVTLPLTPPYHWTMGNDSPLFPKKIHLCFYGPSQLSLKQKWKCWFKIGLEKSWIYLFL